MSIDMFPDGAVRYILARYVPERFCMLCGHGELDPRHRNCPNAPEYRAELAYQEVPARGTE